MQMCEREMVWIEASRMWAWACSEYAWTFSPSGSPCGGSLDEMKQNYERQRDKEYASHVCADYPGPNSAQAPDFRGYLTLDHAPRAPAVEEDAKTGSERYENKQSTKRKRTVPHI